MERQQARRQRIILDDKARVKERMLCLYQWMLDNGGCDGVPAAVSSQILTEAYVRIIGKLSQRQQPENEDDRHLVQLQEITQVSIWLLQQCATELLTQDQLFYLSMSQNGLTLPFPRVRKLSLELLMQLIPRLTGQNQLEQASDVFSHVVPLQSVFAEYSVVRSVAEDVALSSSVAEVQALELFEVILANSQKLYQVWLLFKVHYLDMLLDPTQFQCCPHQVLQLLLRKFASIYSANVEQLAIMAGDKVTRRGVIRHALASYNHVLNITCPQLALEALALVEAELACQTADMSDTLEILTYVLGNYTEEFDQRIQMHACKAVLECFKSLIMQPVENAKKVVFELMKVYDILCRKVEMHSQLHQYVLSSIAEVLWTALLRSPNLDAEFWRNLQKSVTKDMLRQQSFLGHCVRSYRIGTQWMIAACCATANASESGRKTRQSVIQGGRRSAEEHDTTFKLLDMKHVDEQEHVSQWLPSVQIAVGLFRQHAKEYGQLDAIAVQDASSATEHWQNLVRIVADVNRTEPAVHDRLMQILYDTMVTLMHARLKQTLENAYPLPVQDFAETFLSALDLSEEYDAGKLTALKSICLLVTFKSPRSTSTSMLPESFYVPAYVKIAKVMTQSDHYFDCVVQHLTLLFTCGAPYSAAMAPVLVSAIQRRLEAVSSHHMDHDTAVSVAYALASVATILNLNSNEVQVRSLLSPYVTCDFGTAGMYGQIKHLLQKQLDHTKALQYFDVQCRVFCALTVLVTQECGASCDNQLPLLADECFEILTNVCMGSNLELVHCAVDCLTTLAELPLLKLSVVTCRDITRRLCQILSQHLDSFNLKSSEVNHDHETVICVRLYHILLKWLLLPNADTVGDSTFMLVVFKVIAVGMRQTGSSTSLNEYTADGDVQMAAQHVLWHLLHLCLRHKNKREEQMAAEVEDPKIQYGGRGVNVYSSTFDVTDQARWVLCQNQNEMIPIAALPGVKALQLTNYVMPVDKNVVAGEIWHTPLPNQNVRQVDIFEPRESLLSSNGSKYTDSQPIEPGTFSRLQAELQLIGSDLSSYISRHKEMLSDLKSIDEHLPRETIKVGLFYVAKQQEDEMQILGNCGVIDSSSSEYCNFTKSLGWQVDLATHTSFMGGLERNGVNGTTAIYYADALTEIMFHDVTLMPKDDTDPRHNRKKRHIGNDHVHIVWDEHCRYYRPGTIGGDFGNAVIVVSPSSDDGLLNVRVHRDRKLPFFGPLLDGMKVSRECVGTLIRQTAINAYRATVLVSYHELMPVSEGQHLTAPMLYKFPYKDRTNDLVQFCQRHHLSDGPLSQTKSFNFTSQEGRDAELLVDKLWHMLYIQ